MKLKRFILIFTQDLHCGQQIALVLPPPPLPLSLSQREREEVTPTAKPFVVSWNANLDPVVTLALR